MASTFTTRVSLVPAVGVGECAWQGCPSPRLTPGALNAKERVVAINVYEADGHELLPGEIAAGSKWKRLELWHPACYVTAGSPWGEVV
jgi:hypothetical protein